MIQLSSLNEALYEERTGPECRTRRSAVHARDRLDRSRQQVRWSPRARCGRRLRSLRVRQRDACSDGTLGRTCRSIGPARGCAGAAM